jgi:hypothetical protein
MSGASPERTYARELWISGALRKISVSPMVAQTKQASTLLFKW